MTERPFPPHVLRAIELGKQMQARLAGGAPAEAPAKPKRKPRISVSPKPERTSDDGILFASKRELARYDMLRGLRDTGQVRWFLRQVPFHLPASKYVLDFLVFWADGRITCEDVKGHRTDVYRLKKRQVEALYPITITEI